DPSGSFSIPFDINRYNTNNVSVGDLRTFRVALPKYIIATTRMQRLQLSVHESVYQPELVEDINTIANLTMQENRLKDISNALTRLVIKKLAEAGARAGSKAIAEGSRNSKDS